MWPFKLELVHVRRSQVKLCLEHTSLAALVALLAAGATEATTAASRSSRALARKVTGLAALEGVSVAS